MNKKTIVIIVIVTILLIGIGTLSAGLINYYGKITGTVTILPPETEENCKNDTWENLVTLNGRQFKNQGDCVSYIQTFMCEDFELLEGYPEDFDNYGICVSFFDSEGKSDENQIPVVSNVVLYSVPSKTNDTTTGDTNSTETNDTTTGDTNSTETNDTTTGDIKDNNTTSNEKENTEDEEGTEDSEEINVIIEETEGEQNEE